MSLATAFGAVVFSLALSGTAGAQDAPTSQKALVYCPVGVDDFGCANIASALSGMFAEVDSAYDGSGGTLDLRTADLNHYAVFVVPSLADGPELQPYALLRDATVAARLKTILMGRVAVWSGTPDQGGDNLEEKNTLIRNLATWVTKTYGTSGVTGTVVLQDLSDAAGERYGWLGGISPMTVQADSVIDLYDSIEAVSPAGAEIIKNGDGQLGYTNMASFGLHLPADVRGMLVGALGGSSNRQVVLVTYQGGEGGVASIKTDKDDYYPGDTVTITGSGWQPGETVTMVLHEDPLEHQNRTITAVANDSGRFVDRSFAPEEHHIGVKFLLTAVGEASGRTAQATFTDAVVSATAPSFFTAPGTPSACSSTSTGPSQVGAPVCAQSTLRTNTGSTTNNFVTFRWYRPPSSTTNYTGQPGPADPSTFEERFPATGVIAAGQTVAATSIKTPNEPGTWYVRVCQVNTQCLILASATVSITSGDQTLTITGAGAGSGSVTSDPAGISCTVTAGAPTGTCSASFASGSLVTLTAAPSSGSTFAEWSGDGTGTTTRTVTMDAGKAVGARFKADPTITNAVSPAPSVVGQPYTVAFTLTGPSGAPTPGGSIAVTDGAASCTVTLTAGAGGCSLTATTAGTRTISATYSGNADYNAATASPTHQVDPAATAVAITSRTPESSEVGQAVAVGFSVAVVSPGSGIPTSTVSVSDGSVSCTAEVASGSCSLTPTSAGTKQLVATYQGDGNFTGSTSAAVAHEVNKAAATVTVVEASLSHTYDGTPKSAVATTAPAGLTVAYTYTLAGGTATAPAPDAPPTDAGTYTVTATIVDASYQGSASGSFKIAQATPTIEWSDPAAITYGTALSSAQLKATAKGVGGVALTGTFSYDPAAGTVLDAADQPHTLSVSFTPASGNYTAASKNVSLKVDRASQVITFDGPTNKTYGDDPFAMTATSTSGLAVTVEVTSGPCTVDGTTVTITGAGTCVVRASQPGNVKFLPAEPASHTIEVAKKQATVALSDLTHTYDGLPKAATATTTPGGLDVALTYAPIPPTGPVPPQGPTDAGSYAVTATINHANYQGSASGTLVVNKADQEITFGPLAGKTYGEQPFAVTASASSNLAVSFAAAGPCSISGSMVTITGAGECTITASQAGNNNYNAAGDVPRSFGIARATAELEFVDLTATYTGSPLAVEVITKPANLQGVTVTYDGSAAAPTNAGSYAVVATLDDGNYTGTVSGTFVIEKADQTITFEAPAARKYGEGPVQLEATASSKLPVVFSVSGPCSLSGTSVSITGAGSCVITASQAGNDNYDAASVERSLAIGQAQLTIAANDASKTYGTENPAATWTYSGFVGSDNAGNVAITGSAACSYEPAAGPNVGTYPDAITCAAGTLSSSNYSFVTGAKGTLTITAAQATIALSNLTPTYDGSPRVATATTDPTGVGTSVSYAGTNGTTYGPSTSAPTDAGSYIVTATLTDGNYQLVDAGTREAVASVSATLTIAKAAATLTLDGLSHSYDGTAKSATVTTTPAGLTPVTVTYNGSATPPTAAGEYAVVATLTSPNYTATASGTLTIAKAGQEITFPPLANKEYGDADFTLSATADSKLSVTFALAASSVGCALSGATVSVTGATAEGEACVIVASQGGDGNYNAASEVTQSFKIAKATAALTLSPLTQTYDGSPRVVAATTAPDGLTTVAITYNGSATPPTAAGDYAVVATLDNPNYTASASGTLTIAKADQAISFDALPNKTYGDAEFTLSATAGSKLPVAFALGASSVGCALSGAAVTLTGATPEDKACVIVASQLGDGNHNGAPEVTRSFAIAKAALTVTADDKTKAYGQEHPIPALTGTLAGVVNGDGITASYITSATPASNPGSYAIEPKLSDPAGKLGNYNVTSVNGTLTILKADQTITFNDPTPRIFSQPASSIASFVSASSGLPVTFEETTSDRCTVSKDGTINVKDVGIGDAGCEVTALQAGNANYNEAPAVTRKVDLHNKIDAIFGVSANTLSWSNSKSTDFTVLILTLKSADGTIIFDAARVDASTVTLTGPRGTAKPSIDNKGAPAVYLSDPDADGDKDLLIYFPKNAVFGSEHVGSTQHPVTLNAKLKDTGIAKQDGRPIRGTDKIQLTP